MAQLSKQARLPSLGAMRDALDLSYAELGWVVAAFGLARLVVDLPAGSLADRWNPRSVLIVALVGERTCAGLGCTDARRSPHRSTSTGTSCETTHPAARRGAPVTAEDPELSRHEWRPESPLLLTRAQAARLCQVSEEILDQWSYQPGFPVFRRNGGDVVRMHRAAPECWLEQAALADAPRPVRDDDPPPRPRRARAVSDR